MGQNSIEKIAQRYAVDLEPGHVVRAGDYLSMRPLHVMTHDNTAAVIPKFQSMGAKRIFAPEQPVFALDHDIQNQSPENLGKYRMIEEFARTHGIAFFPAGRGIGHQVMVEEGFAVPGAFVVGSDSHSNLYGGVGSLGTPVVRTDAAAIWATGCPRSCASSSWGRSVPASRARTSSSPSSASSVTTRCSTPASSSAGPA